MSSSEMFLGNQRRLRVQTAEEFEHAIDTSLDAMLEQYQLMIRSAGCVSGQRSNALEGFQIDVSVRGLIHYAQSLIQTLDDVRDLSMLSDADLMSRAQSSAADAHRNIASWGTALQRRLCEHVDLWIARITRELAEDDDDGDDGGDDDDDSDDDDEGSRNLGTGPSP